jgi:hypothetical protein
MEVSNEYLVGHWTVFSSISDFLSAFGCKVRIYLVLANTNSELVNISSFKATPTETNS